MDHQVKAVFLEKESVYIIHVVVLNIQEKSLQIAAGAESPVV
jgi:hypothetical protein